MLVVIGPEAEIARLKEDIREDRREVLIQA
jgi:hypothetical protein